MRFQNILSVLIICFLLLHFESCQYKSKRILVFSKTAGFRHSSIAEGKKAFLRFGQEKNIRVDTTESSSYFCDDSLMNYHAVVFLSTTGDVLNTTQQKAFERYIRLGGGFVGVHAASDTEYEWPWFAKLVGGNFANHPEIQKARLSILESDHPSTQMLPNTWERTDEWYNFKNLNPDTKWLITIDEKTYQGGTHGDTHPMAWYHDYDGGRAFYTALGHTAESYSEELFLKHLWGGLEYAMGTHLPDYSKIKAERAPESNRFSKIIIKEGLNEPMALAISNDGSKVFYCERHGKVFLYEPTKGTTREVAFLKVEDFAGHGLMGMCLDPNFHYNRWVYLFYIRVDSIYQLSRFKFENDQLNMKSEQVILQIPYDREPGAHNGGTILFDKDGNLLISTGDNTPPWQANGFPPFDERPGRKIENAQRTASNTQDLRGKILRIKPNIFGPGYTIPDGNLFPKDGSLGRPEIYAMGCRNPWRMSYDAHTGFVYWGDVGPDAGKDSTIGPRGYDEINQARGPGNFGWPYFIADNKPYRVMDLVHPGEGPLADAEKPVNNSQYNTGAKVLPKPTKAFLYYPYAESPEFPELGKGGRTACAGPVYHYSDVQRTSTVRFPKYYDKKLFIFEWMRDWIKVVTLDEKGEYVLIEPFAEHLRFDHPTHLAFAPDGSLYVLEYGFIWYSQNDNARLSRIIYSEGNRPPVAKISSNDTIGPVPLKVDLSAKPSFDPDNNPIKYTWSVSNQPKVYNERDISLTFDTPGIYTVQLTVEDIHGVSHTQTKKIIVGNSYPQVEIQILGGNKSFYWEDTPLAYKVSISDKEDKSVDPKRASCILNYMPQGKDIFPLVTGHQDAPKERQITENPHIAQSDCKSCHAFKKKSVGPSFIDISNRYKNDPQAVEYLAQKIINGGSGVWGEHAMSAHPQLSKKTVNEMVNYILGLASEDNDKYSKNLALSGVIPSSEFQGKKGWFFLTASYSDKGINGANSLSTYKNLVLKKPNILAIDADSIRKFVAISSKLNPNLPSYVGAFQHHSHLYFDNLDLTAISAISVAYNSNKASGELQIRIDDPNTGKIIGSIPLKPQGVWEKWIDAKVEITATEGFHKLFIVFDDKNKGNLNLSGEYRNINLMHITFYSDKKQSQNL